MNKIMVSLLLPAFMCVCVMPFESDYDDDDDDDDPDNCSAQ
jgi:hypothetical protein